FYRRHKRRILNYVYRMIGDYGCSEEITQEVFVKAYISLPRYTPQGKPLQWIYTIAGNSCKNFFRDKRYQPRLLLNKDLPGGEGLTMQDVIPAGGESPLDAAMSREKEELIQEAVNMLPVKYREVLVLCDIQGYSYEEAALILECKIGSVGSRLSKARSLLARSLSRYFSKGTAGKEAREKDGKAH
ncbi:RNA polymerase sigma factor, partial [Omnitrophica bacterium]|nr:RNA polymerase sigma factor [Candidatus Omnitrophota bacterium]